MANTRSANRFWLIETYRIDKIACFERDGNKLAADFEQTYRDFVDFLAPKLDTYEHAIYAYILRHTMLEGAEDAVIPFKSAREEMSKGVGQRGSAMSEATCREKLRSLSSRGAIEIIRTEHKGTRVRLVRPDDISGVIPEPPATEERTIEDIDYFEIQEHRRLIFEREDGRCFYTLVELDEENFVIDHVISRPKGDNGYRNVVACSREANNRKGSMDAEDFLFRQHREGVLDFDQLGNRLEALKELKAGHRKPRMPIF